MIAAGETITIPAGRMAVLPNVTVEGTLVIDGEVFVPSGAVITLNQILLKAPDDSVWALTVSPTGVLSTEVYNG